MDIYLALFDKTIHNKITIDNHDKINEILEHPHSSTPIFVDNSEPKYPSDDLINDMLERKIEPHFTM